MAYLFLGALYLLLTVYAIPFTLAQRKAAERSEARASPASAFPATSNSAAAPSIATSVVLQSQPHRLSSSTISTIPCASPTPPTPGEVTSQDFEPELDSYDSFTGDDFVVLEGQIWNITEVDVIGEYSEPPVQPDSFHVFFYAGSGTLPGTLIASRLANPYSGFIDFVITLTSPVMLGPGTYWVSVQAREDFTSSGEWFWGNRLVMSNSGAAWQNPGGGFGANCPTWGRKTTCRPTQNGPDQLYRLVGTIGVGTATPAPPQRTTPTPRPRQTPPPRP